MSQRAPGLLTAVTGLNRRRQVRSDASGGCRVSTLPISVVQEAKKQVEKPKSVAQEDDFTPPPISKKSDGKDLVSMWQALLMNIKSPSTQALLKLATPLRIAEDGIVITIKNERLVSQMNEVNKKQLVIDAAKVIFNGANVPITIRLAQNGDKPIEVKQVASSQAKPVEKEEVQVVIEKKSESIETVQEVIQQEKASSKEELRAETDQERIVLDLFDGKIVN